MLIELKVSNFAIIENIHLSFKEGFNIISGETGSGKSVLLKSLALLMGAKSSPDIIRNGADQAIVEGCFDISNRLDIKNKLVSLGIESDDTLIVRRLIIADKSRVYINGQMSSLHLLKDLISPIIEVTGPSAPLIELTGQHENKNLMSNHYHLDTVDRFAGLWETRQKYESLLQEKANLEKRKNEIELNSKNKEQRLDYLYFQKNEISTLDMEPGEDLQLETDIKKIKSAHKILSLAQSIQNILEESNDSALSRINTAVKKLNDLSQLEPTSSQLQETLDQAQSNLSEFLYSLQSYLDKIDLSDDLLEEKEDKLNRLRKLQKKYGPGLDEILNSLIQIENEITQLESLDKDIQKIVERIQTLTEDLWKLSHTMHQARVKASQQLKALVNKELEDLNMKGVVFGISIATTDRLGPFGTTELEFTTQANLKDSAKPLAKFASGGELSRILLSLKKVGGASDLPRTFLFDEVDTGVSGETAEKVGKKLRSIAKGQQVICVTHLPQVAASGDHHYLIYKEVSKDKTIMTVQELTDSERVKELARLISGEKITKTSLAHAEELLKHYS